MRQALPLVHIVDDDPLIREEAEELLADVGLDVHTHEDAKSFFADLDPNPLRPQCAVLDIRLPGVGGLGIQKKLRELHQDLPVIFLTSHADTATVVDAVKSGARDVIEKPIHPQMLLRQVQSAIEDDAGKVNTHHRAARLREQIDKLFSREREVFWLLIGGKNSKEIAVELGIAVQTVAKHRARILAKLGAANVVDLVRRISLDLPEILDGNAASSGDRNRMPNQDPYNDRSEALDTGRRR